jgi:hypothetical protein
MLKVCLGEDPEIGRRTNRDCASNKEILPIILYLMTAYIR